MTEIPVRAHSHKNKVSHTHTPYTAAAQVTAIITLERKEMMAEERGAKERKTERKKEKMHKYN